MDAVEFIKEYYRICEAHEDCVDCPFIKEEIDIPCDLISKNAEKIVSIVKQWAKEHPRKTMIQDFFEKFPNAPRTVNGLPFPCPFKCGYTKNSNCPFGRNNPSDDCSECWFRLLEES